MEGKTLLITGASSEVGIRIISSVYQDYDMIYAHYGHHSEELVKLQQKLGDKLRLLQEDFSTEKESDCGIMQQLLTDAGLPLHLIHLPAPAVEEIRFSDVSWKSFEENINISLRSAVMILQPILNEMVKRKVKGKAVIMLSSCTQNIPPKYMAPYVTVKYALLGLMKALSAEYADKGITVNGISPGMMETKFLDRLADHTAEMNAFFSPLGRNLQVDEMIPAVRFLLSDGADMITGQNLAVTGGMR